MSLQKCASHYLTIRVKDVNDNPPVFLQSSYVVTNISEATKIGSTILQVSATDADQVTTVEGTLLENPMLIS